MIYLELRNGVGMARDLAYRVNPEGPIFGPYKFINCDQGIIRCENKDQAYILRPHRGNYYYEGEWYATWCLWEEKRMRKLPGLRDRVMPFVQQYANLPGHIYAAKLERGARR